MKAAVKTWPAPVTKVVQIEELAGLGLIQEKAMAEWRALGQHRVPTLNPGEIVHFLSFVRAGICLPASSFLHRFLCYFGIRSMILPPMEFFMSLFLSTSVKFSLASLHLTLVETVKDWRAEWFYAGNMSLPLTMHSDVGSVPND